MKNRFLLLIGLLLVLTGLVYLRAQTAYSISPAGGCFDDPEGTMKINYWSMGDLIVEPTEDGELLNYSGLIPAALNEQGLLSGIEGLKAFQELIAFPIPCEDHVQLQIPWKGETAITVSIYSSLGVLARKEKIALTSSHLVIETSDLISGVYFILVQEGTKGKAMTRIIKQ